MVEPSSPAVWRRQGCARAPRALQMRRLSGTRSRATVQVDALPLGPRQHVRWSCPVYRLGWWMHSGASGVACLKRVCGRAAPDAPEHVYDQRRCTGYDHRTSCRGSSGSASLPTVALHRLIKSSNPRVYRVFRPQKPDSEHAHKQNGEPGRLPVLLGVKVEQID